MQIGGDARDRPALAVQGEHRVASRGGVGDLMVGRESAPDEDRQRVFGEDAPHRVVARTATELDTTDLGDLMVVEGGKLGLEHEDGPLDFLGQGAMALHFRRAEQAGHPFALEERGLPIQSALGSTGQASAFRRGVTEEHDGADEFVGVLLGEADEQVKLLPIVGRLDALPIPHCRPPSARG